MNALEVNKVNKVYANGHQALHEIDFQIKLGDFVGLLGMNGAGKTTLISAIAGINKFSGQIKVMGNDVISQVVKAKQCLGVVPQEVAFDPFLTVYQTLKFQSGLYGVNNNQEWLDEVIQRMHLQDKVNANTRSLSGGMKRRLMVAQALVHKPAVIILDEPTAGVDVEIRKDLWKFIQELHRAGHTILLTTHYLEEVEALCNQIIMIDKGKIIAQSSKDELISKANGLATVFEIETKDGQFSSNLAKLIISREENRYFLRLESNEEISQILAQLHQDGVKINNISINKPKLEEIFLNALGR